MLSAMGKSRSATVLSAYLMQTRNLDAEAAIALIRETRSFVEPNPGFMEQLELYHKMQFAEDLDAHPAYQRWLYQKDLEINTAAGRAPNRVHFRDAEKAVADINEMADSAPSAPLIELRCKMCRYVGRPYRISPRY